MDERAFQDHQSAGIQRRVRVDELVADARALAATGVPFRHQGRGVEGLDCVGFIIYLMSQRGVVDVDDFRRDYGRLPMAELVETIAKLCAPIAEPREGAMVLIRWPGEGRPAHAALLVEDARGIGLNLIHCYKNAGGIVEHGFRGLWPKRADSYWLLPWVSYE